MAQTDVKWQYTQAVEYAKYKVCFLDVYDSNMFSIFKEEMTAEIKKNLPYLMKRLEDLRGKYADNSVASTHCYGFKIVCDYSYMIDKMKKKFII